jgi:hypothetical protein
MNYVAAAGVYLCLIFFLSATNDTVIHYFASFFLFFFFQLRIGGIVFETAHAIMVLFICIFEEQYLPICNSFPPLQPLQLAFLLFPCPCVRRPAWSVRVPPIFTPVLQLQRKRIQQGNGFVRSQLAVKEDKERSLTPSNGWDFLPKRDGWDERV